MKPESAYLALPLGAVAALALGSGAAPIDFIWEIYDAAREARFETGVERKP